MIQIKSIFLKLFITYIIILIVSHFVFTIASYFLFQNHLTNIHLNSEHFNQIKYLFLLSSIISLSITGLFTYYLSKRITAPIREMNRVALHIARGQFDQRVKTRDELGRLGEAFNYMADELASLDQMRKDFVANVSHDLRSPLTSIHGFVRAFLDETIPSERKRHYFTIMKEQTERMIKLVNDLLDMARIEAGQLESGLSSLI
jgi:signal transduction histidine kinase